MINFENIKEVNPNLPQIPDYPYRKLIIGGSGSGKKIHKSATRYQQIYLYAKDSNKAKYQFLINKRESTGLKHFNDSKAFIE